MTLLSSSESPTGSMQNTITIGDHLWSTSSSLAWSAVPFLPQGEIKRGDIVVLSIRAIPQRCE